MPPHESGNKKQVLQPPGHRSSSSKAAEPPAVVDPIWLFRAFCVAVGAAVVCAYASLCLLLYQGQWQLILHPKRSSVVPAFIGDTPVQLVHFGTDDTGTPQLTGWMVPALAGSRYKDVTVLFLPSGNGSIVDQDLTLRRLHEVGVALFAMDYRGYGQSAALHPNEERMREDSEAAFTYLESSRAIPEKKIVLYGAGLGASLATYVASRHAAIPAIVLDSPGQDPLRTLSQDARTRLLPIKLLLHERFALVEPLARLKTPKLLIYSGTEDAAFSSAADPKITADVSEAQRTTAPRVFTDALTRFLDQYVAVLNPEQQTATNHTLDEAERTATHQ